jgi:hypothetical protein
LDSQFIDSEHKILHQWMMVDDSPHDDTPLEKRTIFGSVPSGRTVTSGKIFEDSELPDLVFGTLKH